MYNWGDGGKYEGKDDDSLFADVNDRRIVQPVAWTIEEEADDEED